MSLQPLHICMDAAEPACTPTAYQTYAQQPDAAPEPVCTMPAQSGRVFARAASSSSAALAASTLAHCGEAAV